MPNETINQTAEGRLTVGWTNTPTEGADRAPVNITTWRKIQLHTPGYQQTFTMGVPLATGEWSAGPDLPLDRDAIDHLIRTLTKARRQAFGTKVEGQVAISMPRNSGNELHPTTAMVIDLASGKPLAVSAIQIRLDFDGACTADLTVYADTDGHPLTLEALANMRRPDEFTTAQFTYEVLAFGVNANKGDEVPTPPPHNVFAADAAFRDAFPALALHVDAVDDTDTASVAGSVEAEYDLDTGARRPDSEA
jgi:hypothetical protein